LATGDDDDDDDDSGGGAGVISSKRLFGAGVAVVTVGSGRHSFNDEPGSD
jgi:hypothetical protein